MDKFKSISGISKLHYIKLLVRGLMFLLALAAYIQGKVIGGPMFARADRFHALELMVTALFSIEMIFRFFPSRLESMGCQKQFSRNYRPAAQIDRKTLRKRSAAQIVPVILSWVALNGLVALAYYRSLIDWGMMILIALFYSVSDMICILFFCPFQTWMMGNKCCGTCRIYNWDYAMMFTPLIFLPSLTGHILVALSLVLLLRWEITFFLHPERFYEDTNACLSCGACEEKLCQHKKQLQAFHRSLRKRGRAFR